MALIFTELDRLVSDAPFAAIETGLFSEIKTNLQDVSASAGYTKGTDFFAGPLGVEITIDEMADTNYHVDIMPNADPGGNLGEIWVVANSVTQFTVYNSGTATTTFKWRLTA